MLKERRERRSQEQQARWTELQTRRKTLKMRDKRNNLTDEQREEIKRKKAERWANAPLETKILDVKKRKARREKARRRAEENQALLDDLRQQMHTSIIVLPGTQLVSVEDSMFVLQPPEV